MTRKATTVTYLYRTICCAAMVALVAGSWAIRTFVVPHPDPAIRGQVFQMCQVAHFLWPPFLFAGLYRARNLER